MSDNILFFQEVLLKQIPIQHRKVTSVYRLPSYLRKKEDHYSKNTFAFECCLLKKILNEPFRLKIISNLTHEFFMTILARKCCNFSFLIMSSKNQVSNLMYFQEKIAYLIFPKSAEKRKCFTTKIKTNIATCLCFDL